MVIEKERLVLFAGFISCLFVLIAIVVVALAPPASHYEISIYEVYPPYLWLFLTIPLMMPFIILMLVGRNALAYYVPLFAGSLLSITILLSIPILRGYAFYSGGDAFTHLGYVKDIQVSGHFASNNLYPIIHILITSGSFASGVDAEPLMSFIPLIFSLFSLASVFLLARALTKDLWRSAVIFAFAMVFLFNTGGLQTVPSAEAFFLIPISIFLYVESKSKRASRAHGFSLTLIVFLILLPFFHPEPTLFMLVILIVFALVIRRRNVVRTARIEVSRLIPRNNSTPALILMVAFFAWFTSCVAFGNTVRTVYNSLILNLGTSPVSSYTSMFDTYDVSPAIIARLLILTYGVLIICFSLAAISTIRIVVSAFSGKKVLLGVGTFSVLFIIFSGLAALFMVADLIIGNRTMKYLLLVSSMLAGLEVYRLRFAKARPSRSWTRPAIAVSLVIMMATASGLAVGVLYPSPLINRTNWQVTDSEFDGMTYYFLHRNSSMLTLEIAMSQSRFKDAILGSSVESPNIRYGEAARPLDHFGYNVSNYFGDSYSDDVYLITNALAEQLYPSAYPEFPQFWRFTPDDFSELTSDPTVDLIYDNGGFSLYLIKSTSFD
ncbi:MAG: hypothetical protein KKE24_04420 [Candidatus Thermoplasmatota archaeon]|nr:hypothetical protein [Candidatus Thermoplasmatota archaeon]